MSDAPDTQLPDLSDTVGLCAACRHVRVINNPRGSRFYLCQLSEVDPRFPKYPRLPIAHCVGYESISSGVPEDST